MDSSEPRRPLPVEFCPRRHSLAVAGVVLAVEVCTSSFTKEICIVCRWTKGDRFCCSTKQVAEIMRLQSISEGSRRKDSAKAYKGFHLVSVHSIFVIDDDVMRWFSRAL